MKTKLLLLSLLMLFTFTTNYAQTSASQAGIAVQGIARDANNTALTSKQISLTFELYYFNSSNLEQSIFSETQSVDTDDFGVFSHIIDPTAVNNSKFANNEAYLRIKMGATEIISNEKLKHVPYAISANNGVPTGSIMPFIGTAAPYGWALCNGSALPTTATKLIAMVGANTPNLQGMFLRGTGTSFVNSQAGPALKGTQSDTIKTHTSTGTTAAGDHDHTETRLVRRNIDEEDDDYNANGNILYGAIAAQTLNTGGTGAHTHNLSVTYTGASETRPVSFGVNYIIKL